MLLTFSWERFGGLRPRCDSDAPEGYPNALAGLLMDDGGLDLAPSIEWIDIGLASTAAVLRGESCQADWGREHWGATISRDSTRVSWEWGEGLSEHGETLATPTFHSILSRWRAFIAAPDETCMVREQHEYVSLPG